ncbi:YjbF family lipoprotein [Vibrio intestinalis]|uniref:YjbF family lipoprotein n=1 Tax=Vibrio intestinalis TaxID=2933291 RepID=UPI0021A7D8E1|nr:YjbF family lipoprotein [Vibrio intestinalis]
MKHSTSILSLSLLFIISGCSQKSSDSFATAYEAAFGGSDVVLDKETLSQIPYASSYFKINNGPQVFMVLAYAEINPDTGNTQLKWMSSDSAMIVTENGRVTKTLNLPEFNLSGLYTDLLKNSFVSNPVAGKAIYDWQPNYSFNTHANINLSYSGDEILQSTLWSKTTKIWQESITDSNKNRYQNTYWVDNSGTVVKSHQWAIPGKLFIEQEILKTYLAN